MQEKSAQFNERCDNKMSYYRITRLLPFRFKSDLTIKKNITDIRDMTIVNHDTNFNSFILFFIENTTITIEIIKVNIDTSNALLMFIKKNDNIFL